MWCRAVAAHPLRVPRCAQPFDATAVAATEPAVATTATTAVPWWCWACGAGITYTTIYPHHQAITYTTETTATAMAFPAAVAAVVGCGWWISDHHRGVVRPETTIVVAVGRRYSHHSHTMWCRAVAAQPLRVPRFAQPFDATAVVATEPAVATTATTAVPWWCWACGGDPPIC
nr:hypothetical protein [Tanacetum cinerariifolium]